MTSEFKLIGGRYLYKQEIICCTIIDQDYAGPILDKLREIELATSAEHALHILQQVMKQDTLSLKIRNAHNLDAIKAQATPEAKKAAYGTKYKCNAPSCGQVFYDLNKLESCSKCFRSKTLCTKVG